MPLTADKYPKYKAIVDKWTTSGDKQGYSDEVLSTIQQELTSFDDQHLAQSGQTPPLAVTDVGKPQGQDAAAISGALKEQAGGQLQNAITLPQGGQIATEVDQFNKQALAEQDPQTYRALQQLNPSMPLMPQMLQLTPNAAGAAARRDAPEYMAGVQAGVDKAPFIAYEPPLSQMKKDLLNKPDLVKLLSPHKTYTAEQINAMGPDEPLYADYSQYLWHEAAQAAEKSGTPVYRYSKTPWFHGNNFAENVQTAAQKGLAALKGPVQKSAQSFVLGLDDTGLFHAGHMMDESADKTLGGVNDAGQTRAEYDQDVEQEHPNANEVGKLYGLFSGRMLPGRVFGALGRAAEGVNALRQAPGIVGTVGRTAASAAVGAVGNAAMEGGEAGTEALRGEAPTWQNTLRRLAGAGEAGAGFGTLAHGVSAVMDVMAGRINKRFQGIPKQLEANKQADYDLISGVKEPQEAKALRENADKTDDVALDMAAEKLAPPIAKQANEDIRARTTQQREDKRAYYAAPEGKEEVPLNNTVQKAVELLDRDLSPAAGQGGKLTRNSANSAHENIKSALNGAIDRVEVGNLDQKKGGVVVSPEQAEAMLGKDWQDTLREQLKQPDLKSGERTPRESPAGGQPFTPAPAEGEVPRGANKPVGTYPMPPEQATARGVGNTVFNDPMRPRGAYAINPEVEPNAGGRKIVPLPTRDIGTQFDADGVPIEHPSAPLMKQAENGFTADGLPLPSSTQTAPAELTREEKKVVGMLGNTPTIPNTPHLESALRKIRVDSPGTLYKGMGLTEEALSQIQKDGQMEFKNYSSAGKDRDYSSGYAYTSSSGASGRRPVLVQIDGMPVGYQKSSREMLIPPGKYKVDSVSDHEIEVPEIGKKLPGKLLKLVAIGGSTALGAAALFDGDDAGSKRLAAGTVGLAALLRERGVKELTIIPKRMNAYHQDNHLDSIIKSWPGDRSKLPAELRELDEAARLDRDQRSFQGQRGGWSQKQNQTHEDLNALEQLRDRVTGRNAADPEGGAFNQLVGYGRKKPGERLNSKALREVADKANVRPDLDSMRVLDARARLASAGNFGPAVGTLERKPRTVLSPTAWEDAALLRAYPWMAKLGGRFRLDMATAQGSQLVPQESAEEKKKRKEKRP